VRGKQRSGMPVIFDFMKKFEKTVKTYNLHTRILTICRLIMQKPYLLIVIILVYLYAEVYITQKKRDNSVIFL